MNNWKKQLGDLLAILLGNAVYALAVAALTEYIGLITGRSAGLAMIAGQLSGAPVETSAA